MAKLTEYDQKLNAEIERRIARMEQEDYTYPPRFAKKDYLLLGIVCVLCLLAVLAGGFLG